jgi:peptidoglycan/LPS O-acetylase OafA/YrhL
LRVVRLWPLIVAGLALGASYLIVRNHLEPSHAVSIGYLLTAIIFGLVLLPLNLVLGREGYPLDLPCWSLLFEIIANVFYALLCRYRRISTVPLFLVIGCSLLLRFVDSRLELFDAPHNFTNRVALAITFLNGTARVGLGFFIGVALYRHRNHRFVRRIPQLHPALASLLLVILFAMPPFSSNTYDTAVTILVMPIILAASANRESHGLEASVCEFSGWLSYPLYVVHYPVMFVTVGAFKYAGKWAEASMIGVEIVTLVAGIVAAYLLGKFYDEPARAWLAARIRTKASGPHLDTTQTSQSADVHPQKSQRHVRE